MSRRDLDEFLGRADEVLAGPGPAPAACAWCSHPLDDASPSGDFCGERCAADWRAGLDRDPDERCACRTCDPEWWADVADPAFTAAARALATERGFRDLPARDVWATPRPSPADMLVSSALTDQARTALRDLSTDLPPASLAFWEHHLRLAHPTSVVRVSGVTLAP